MKTGPDISTGERWFAAAGHAATSCTPTALRNPGAVVRVALAHRDPVARAALRAVLRDDPDIAVVGEAATSEEVAALATQLRPDVIAMDVALPGTGCVVATRRARRVCGVAVMLLSGDDPDPRVLAALQAGATGVMRPESAPSDLIRALTLIGRGRPLRPRRAPPVRRAPKEMMNATKVVAIRGDSAHAAGLAPARVARASRVRHDVASSRPRDSSLPGGRFRRRARVSVDDA
jgi:DNA-binding NarL/FixJ family response regulator